MLVDQKLFERKPRGHFRTLSTCKKNFFFAKKSNWWIDFKKFWADVASVWRSKKVEKLAWKSLAERSDIVFFKKRREWERVREGEREREWEGMRGNEREWERVEEWVRGIEHYLERMRVHEWVWGCEGISKIKDGRNEKEIFVCLFKNERGREK